MISAMPDFDAVVIGAGFSGMHMLKSLRDKLGLKVRAYEAADTVGGTWYWNRYPAKFQADAERAFYALSLVTPSSPNRQEVLPTRYPQNVRKSLE